MYELPRNRDAINSARLAAMIAAADDSHIDYAFNILRSAFATLRAECFSDRDDATMKFANENDFLPTTIVFRNNKIYRKFYDVTVEQYEYTIDDIRKLYYAVDMSNDNCIDYGHDDF